MCVRLQRRAAVSVRFAASPGPHVCPVRHRARRAIAAGPSSSWPRAMWVRGFWRFPSNWIGWFTMGGRGRDREPRAEREPQFLADLPQREHVHSDHWSWVGDLSDQRLENYGHVMARREQEGILQDEQGAFLRELRKEHRHRSGELPLWGDHEKARAHNAIFSAYESRDYAEATRLLNPSAPVPDSVLAPAPVPAPDDVSARVAKAAKAVRAASDRRVARAAQAVRAAQESPAAPQSSAADVDPDRARKDARNARDRARRAARRAERERDQ